MLAGLGLAAAGPAAASGTTWNYIVMPTWQGNCPGGGSVIWVGAASWSASTSFSAADGGDDIVYLRVGLNEPVTITGNVICRAWWGQYNGPAVSVSIQPTRFQQSWYIGPNGVSHN
jgi:hypothetical protein